MLFTSLKAYLWIFFDLSTSKLFTSSPLNVQNNPSLLYSAFCIYFQLCNTHPPLKALLSCFKFHILNMTLYQLYANTIIHASPTHLQACLATYINKQSSSHQQTIPPRLSIMIWVKDHICPVLHQVHPCPQLVLGSHLPLKSSNWFILPLFGRPSQ